VIEAKYNELTDVIKVVDQMRGVVNLHKGNIKQKQIIEKRT
jgi:hypothetical protein